MNKQRAKIPFTNYKGVTNYFTTQMRKTVNSAPLGTWTGGE